MTTLRRGGCEPLGTLNTLEQALLRDAYEIAVQDLAEEWRVRRAAREIFWINLWQSGDRKKGREVGEDVALDRWVRRMVAEAYPHEATEVDGYGFGINPVGSRTQAWHLDYTLDYANLFIPIEPFTVKNGTQYLELSTTLPEDTFRRAIADPDIVDVEALLSRKGAANVRQLLAEPYTVLKMDFGTIHRGITNGEAYDRAMFWVSVTRPGGAGFGGGAAVSDL